MDCNFVYRQFTVEEKVIDISTPPSHVGALFFNIPSMKNKSDIDFDNINYHQSINHETYLVVSRIQILMMVNIVDNCNLLLDLGSSYVRPDWA